MSKKIAFFDFDGTITRKDTMLEMVKFSHGATAYYKGLARISPTLVGLQLGFISAQQAKEKLLQQFYANYSVAAFDAICETFTEQVMPTLIRTDALQCIQQHRAEGTTVVVVSASAENWIAPWCRQQQIAFIGTRLQQINGKLTGKLEGNNCNGKEKVSRILLSYDPALYDVSYGYGDSKGDREMLALVQRPFFKLFVQ